MDILGILFALCIGVAISAACGFRVFLPILIIGILQRFGSEWGLPLNVPESLSWAGNGFILLGLGIATILEITAFYIPWLDSLLDTISAPMAVIAGTVLTYCVLDDASSDTSRILLSLIGGGGSAGVVAGTTALARSASTVLTAGLGNNVIATTENGLSIFSVILALVFPILGVIFLAIFLIVIIKIISHLRKKKKQHSAQAEAI